MVEVIEPYSSQCPVCRAFVQIKEGVCPTCGFPFLCDLEPTEVSPLKQVSSFFSRLILVTAVLSMLIYFTNFSYSSSEGYSTETISKLEKGGLIELSIPTNGPSDFAYRVQLALTLLKRRAPDFYGRVLANISSISFVPEERIELDGRRIYLTGVSAYIEPSNGETRIRVTGAYLSGLNELYDRDIFYLAGVLVHEMRHRELYKSGLNVGGAAEEFECEATAYDMLARVGAPRSLTYSLYQFLINPNHPRYKAWGRYYGRSNQPKKFVK